MIMENVHLLASFWPIRIKLLEYYWIFRIVYDYSENCSILSEFLCNFYVYCWALWGKAKMVKVGKKLNKPNENRGKFNKHNENV